MTLNKFTTRENYRSGNYEKNPLNALLSSVASTDSESLEWNRRAGRKFMDELRRETLPYSGLTQFASLIPVINEGMLYTARGIVETIETEDENLLQIKAWAIESLTALDEIGGN